MKTATEMTEKQRCAVKAMEGARNERISLNDYAKARGLVIRVLYDAIAGLRRKGLLAQAAKGKRRRKFVAVRVAPEQGLPVASTAMSIPVCRVVQPGPRDRVSAVATAELACGSLSPGSADAAS